MVDGRKHIDKRATVPIDSTGVVFEAGLEIMTLASINIEGDSTAGYSIDVSPDGETFFTDQLQLSGTSLARTFNITDRVIRLRVTDTGNAGDEAEVVVQGAR
jgi:hypothetical protein